MPPVDDWPADSSLAGCYWAELLEDDSADWPHPDARSLQADFPDDSPARQGQVDPDGPHCCWVDPDELRYWDVPWSVALVCPEALL